MQICFWIKRINLLTTGRKKSEKSVLNSKNQIIRCDIFIPRFCCPKHSNIPPASLYGMLASSSVRYSSTGDRLRLWLAGRQLLYALCVVFVYSKYVVWGGWLRGMVRSYVLEMLNIRIWDQWSYWRIYVYWVY